MKKDKLYQTKLNDSFKTILDHKEYLYNINNKLENNILYPIDINRICKIIEECNCIFIRRQRLGTIHSFSA